MARWPNENVMVVESRLLDELGRFHGFCADVDRYLSVLLDPRNIRFIPRDQAEEDPTYKQLIPYCVLRSGNLVFRYRRGRQQGERRLHNLESIGIGGHISVEDRNLFNLGTVPYTDAMLRELAEEVEVETTYRQRIVGLINDDTTEVGQVHLGIVHLFELDQPQVQPRESGLKEAGFVPLSVLRLHRHRLETWSQFCLDALFPVGGRSAAYPGD